MKILDYKVIKSNELIEAKSAFSAIEHRVILLALAQIKPTDEKLKMYKINIRDVLDEKSKNNHHLIRKSVDKLHESTIKIEEEDGWKSYSFIIKAQGKYRNSYIEIQFHEDIQQFLLGLKSRYTSYTLSNVINFKKNYSLRIYELCKQYQKIKKRDLSIDYLRTLFSLEGKYKRYNDFKKDVIKTSLEEINQHSDLYLKYEEVKEGRKVSKIRFLIYRNKAITDESQLLTLDQIDLRQGIKDRLMKAGFNCEEISGLREKYTETRISSVLGHFESHMEDIKHPKAWIEKTLQEYVDKADYKAVVERDLREKKEEEDRKKNIASKTLEIQDLETKIARDKADIAEYQETGNLRIGDVEFRFKGKTVENAIDELEDRVIDNEALLKKAERELKKLLK